jgi:hypothetical protein
MTLLLLVNFQVFMGEEKSYQQLRKKAGATRNSFLTRSMKLDDKFALGEASKPFSNARPSQQVMSSR